MAVIEDDLSALVEQHELDVPCPTCGRHGMPIAAPRILEELSIEGRRRVDAEPGVAEHHIETVGVFTALLTCRCGESATVTGNWERWPNEVTGIGLVTLYGVRFVWPPVPLFRPPAETPQAITAALTAASALTWVNPTAAAAGLRTAVERLLDHEGRPPRKNLNDRLERAKEERRLADVVDLLLATKWIGNMGAHEEVTHAELLDSARVLEEALRLLYDQNSAATRALAADINRRKGNRE